MENTTLWHDAVPDIGHPSFAAIRPLFPELFPATLRRWTCSVSPRMLYSNVEARGLRSKPLKAWMLLGMIPMLFSHLAWGQMPPPAEVVILTPGVDSPGSQVPRRCRRHDPPQTASPGSATPASNKPDPGLQVGAEERGHPLPDMARSRAITSCCCSTTALPAIPPPGQLAQPQASSFMTTPAPSRRQPRRIKSSPPSFGAGSTPNPPSTLAVSRRGHGVDPADARHRPASWGRQRPAGGAEHLRRVKAPGGLLKQYDGNVALATAAYNAGAGAVRKHGGIPPLRRDPRLCGAGQLLHQRYQGDAERPRSVTPSPSAG